MEMPTRRLWLSKAIAISAIIAVSGGCATSHHCDDDLPRPYIVTGKVIRSAERGGHSGSFGVMNMILTPSDPIFTIWNDPNTKSDKWADIELQTVKPDGGVVIRLNDHELEAGRCEVFPGTGIRVVYSDPQFQVAILKSAFKHHVMYVLDDDVPSGPGAESAPPCP